MDFREATDKLFERVEHADLAEALGVSIASIRQARLAPSAKAHREAPKNWRYSVISLSEKRIMEHRELIEKLRAEL